MYHDLVRLPILAPVNAVDHHAFVFPLLPVVDLNQAFAYQPSASLIDFSQIQRIARAIAAGIGGADVAEPEKLPAGMPHQVRTGAGREEGSPLS